MIQNALKLLEDGGDEAGGEGAEGEESKADVASEAKEKGGDEAEESKADDKKPRRKIKNGISAPGNLNFFG